MSALFETPEIPAPIIPPPPPTTDEAASGQRRSDQMRKRKGRAATVLTSPEGINTLSTGAPTLLGA